MPNDLKLQEGHPLDENLRPIKVGGKSSAIETAQHGNGARVNGNLEVTGDAYASIEKMYLGLFPAYSGMIIGYRCIGEDTTPVTFTLTTSMATLSSQANVMFNAPPSGKVEVNFQAHYFGGNGATVTLGISDAAVYSALSAPSAQYEKVSFDVSRFDDAILNQNWVITGLTAGTTYQYWIGAKTSSTSGTPTIKYGGDSAGENVPLIIKVTALPEAATGFAEYA